MPGMTTLTLTSSDPRHQRAILLAADSGQWLRPDRLIAGRRVVGIPSSRDRARYWFTDGVTCQCPDFQRRGQACKHIIAAKLDAIARSPRQPQPASTVIDGLSAMVRANSDRYEEIFGRL